MEEVCVDWSCDGGRVSVLPQVDGADVSLDAGSSTQHFATVLPQALEHHLHRVLKETHSRQQLQSENPEALRCFHKLTFLKCCVVFDQ